MLNDLNGSEWTKLSKSVQIYNSPITQKRRDHGAAFPIVLAKHFINIYSKVGDLVLDPFAGVGTTIDAANILKRNGFGMEINKDFFDLFQAGIDPKDGKLNSDYKRDLYLDDVVNLKKYFQKQEVDLIVTSPPYSNLLNNIRSNFADKDFVGNIYKGQHRKLAKPYSTNPKDLGNLSFEEYLKSIKSIMKNLYTISKPGAYNVWVVRDFRDFNYNKPYINLHGDIINAALKSNWILWDIVIWDQSNQRKLVRLGGGKSRRFYFNIGHSFILVFRKNLENEKF